MRKACEVSSHHVARGVLHLLQMVLSSRWSGRELPHSIQNMFVGCAEVVELGNFLRWVILIFGSSAEPR